MPMPLMPATSGVASPQSPAPSLPVGAGGDQGGGLSGLLGASPAPAQLDPQAQLAAVTGAMQQFDQIAAQVEDLARMFPGNEQLASQVISALQQWRQTVIVSMSPASAMMPGAPAMM